MLSNFIIAAEQVSVVFIIALLGYLGGKTGLLSDETADGMCNIAVYFVTPAVIVMAFQREFDFSLVNGFAITIVGNLLAFVFCVVLCHLIIRDSCAERKNILRASAIFGNIGMLSLPLQQALFGPDGVFYCAASMAVFNLTFWSYCAATMGEKGEGKKLIRRVLLNPGLLGTGVGLVLFFASVTIPEVPAAAMNGLYNLNMPMCMLIIGQRMSKIPLNTLFDDKGIWKIAAVRLVLVPLLAIAALRAAGINGAVAICLVISLAAPAAASVNMLAATYKQDVGLAAKVVSMHTLLSVFTMPVIIALSYEWLM